MPKVVLQVEGLTKRYGDLAAVDDLSLEIYEGEVLGLLGPNGAGKTTSINLMCGLLKPDAGQVRVDGAPITGGDAEVRARVGVCPQDIVLWKTLTCIEQLQFIGQMYGMAGREARQRGDRLLETLDLTEKRDVQAHKLSGGMQRRLNLLMALVHDPDIVVLDEPEAGLDPQSRVLVREYVKSLARDKTVILTTHNMDEADRVSDRVAILDHGQLLTLDTPEALKKRVGEGDVLEIALGRPEEGQARQALAHLADRLTVGMVGDTLVTRALNIVAILPAIVEALTQADLQPGEARLRENTLEDVFIQLTGRRLRE